MEPDTQTIKAKSLILFLFILIASLLVGCSPNKEGKLVGVESTVGLSNTGEVDLNDAKFGGIVIVELEDGTKIKAIWDLSLGDQMTGGMILEIAPTDNPDLWKVVRIVETS